MGPGSPLYMAPAALQAMETAEVIVGYKTYVDLIAPEVLTSKEVVSTTMRGEIERCETAVNKALEGASTVLVSGGDAGVYGMAGLLLEILDERGLSEKLEVEIVPGIPAVCAAAALLGAPLMNDFSVISLSDLLTPWERILQRIRAAAEADFVMVLYNPRSKKRGWQLAEARDLILSLRPADTPVGIVRNAMREGQSVEVVSLSQIDAVAVDMFNIILVGNSATKVLAGRMVTPRGYFKKYPHSSLGGFKTGEDS